jgi:DNA-binding CsgD family transcriptional regulator
MSWRPQLKEAGLVSDATPVYKDHVTVVYRYAVRKGAIEAITAVAEDLAIGVHDVDEAVAQLVQSRLLRTEDGGHRFLPVDPEIAAALLVSSVEREIYQRRELIDQIRQRIDVFRQDYACTHRQSSAGNSIDYLVGSMEVRGFLKVASDACRDEVLVLQSSKDDADEFDELSQAYLPLLGRGITVRILCPHRWRADFATRMKVKRLTEAGAAVRSVSHIPRAAAVFDRSLAVLFEVSDGETNVARVHNHGVVQFFLDLFNHLWDAATPLSGVESGYTNVADDLQQAIAALMAKGYTDEVVARKLGMSVRTCRRHIAALMRDLDAVSRFQAGVQAARRSLVNSA